MEAIEKLREKARGPLRQVLQFDGEEKNTAMQSAILNAKEKYAEILNVEPDDPEAKSMIACFKVFEINSIDDETVITDTASQLSALLSSTFPKMLELNETFGKEQCAEMLSVVAPQVYSAVEWLRQQSKNYFNKCLDLVQEMFNNNKAAMALCYHGQASALTKRTLIILGAYESAIKGCESYLTCIDNDLCVLASHNMLCEAYLDMYIQDTPIALYNDELFDENSAIIDATYNCLVLRNHNYSEPVRHPDYSLYWQPSFADMNSAYQKSRMYKKICDINDEAKKRAIEAYWESHSDEREQIVKKIATIQSELEECRKIIQDNNELINQAEAEQNRIIKPKEKEYYEAEVQIERIKEQINQLNIFQGRRKRELNALLDEKTIQLSKMFSSLESMKREQANIFETKTSTPSFVLKTAKEKQTNLASQIFELNKKLEKPFE